MLVLGCGVIKTVPPEGLPLCFFFLFFKFNNFVCIQRGGSGRNRVTFHQLARPEGGHHDLFGFLYAACNNNSNCGSGCAYGRLCGKAGQSGKSRSI